MAEGLNVRLPEKLRAFVEERANGLYGSASEYIRELVRRDFEREESRRWAWLENELASGMKADESAFSAVSADDVIDRNRS
jgi:antitoxin ParD1/3/4